MVALALPSWALAQDSDRDSTPDALDAFPCDASAAAQAFAPAEGEHGVLLFEDQWPQQGDLDFNDVALAWHYQARLDAAGRAIGLRATLDVLALGGRFDNGLGLNLPIARGAVARVTRTLGEGAAVELTPSDEDAELTVRVSPNLRELFDGAAGQLNSTAATPRLAGQGLRVDIDFVAPTALPFAAAPFDLFIFRSERPGLEIHRPGYGGTAAMDVALFGTADDGSTDTRHFVDVQGLPFALVLPASAPYPAEATAISALFPRIVGFAASGGTADLDFYTLPVLAAAYRDSTGAGRLDPTALPVAADADRSCIPLVCSGSARDCDGSAANACEVDAWTDPDNCGGCGIVCASGTCNAGSCRGQQRLATGSYRSCAIGPDGRPRCWGEGVLGNGIAYSTSLYPVTSTPLSDVRSIAGANYFFCALREDGHVWCWGNNYYGQLGNGTASNDEVLSPVEVSGLSDATAIATGQWHTCAITAARTVRCWGYNYFGELGDGTYTERHSPVTVLAPTGSGPLSDVVTIAAGSYHTCATTADGRVYCWGMGYNGQLGDGTNAMQRSRATLVPGITTAVDLSAAANEGRATYALLADGTVLAWGGNDNGQLGDGTRSSRNTPAPVPGLSGVVEVAAHDMHTCARLGDGTMRCWGINWYGQLGDRTTNPSLVPVPVVGLDRVAGMAVGYYGTCVTMDDGRIQCWGNGERGSLGDETTISRLEPAPIRDFPCLDHGTSNACDASCTPRTCTSAGVSSGVVPDGCGGTINCTVDQPRFTAESASGCLIRADGTLRCWGGNESGMLGDGSNGNNGSHLAAMAVLGGTDVVAVDSAFRHMCFVRNTGTVHCAGANWYGALGNGTTTHSGTPVQVVGIGNALTVTTGYDFSCALLADRTVRCWGSNRYGQLANGSSSNTPYPEPVAIAGLDDVIALSAGFSDVCAVRSNGRIWCWGSNSEGQLGNGSQFARRPQVVPGIGNATSVSLSMNTNGSTGLFGCAVLADGTVRCWGANGSGQLGDGTTTRRPLPVAVAGLSGVTRIATGQQHACATTSAGALRCWGHNGYGQLGDGTRNPVTTLVAPTGMTSAVYPGAGYAKSCVLRTGGEAWCWGYNGLGAGYPDESLEPRRVQEW